jgi:hypothetical protein
VLAFEIYVNEKKVATAGMKEAGVVSANVTWAKGQKRPGKKPAPEAVDLHVGGLFNATARHVIWAYRRLTKGDNVRIELVEAAKTSRARVMKRETPAQRLKHEQEYVRKKAQSWGWTIQT